MNCTGKNCIMQYDKVETATCTAVPYCQYATPPKTNADRIRAMSDEELARQIAYFTGYEGNPEEVAYWRNWLKNTEEEK